MSHHFINKLSDYDSSGPRPPIPGQEETRKYKVRFWEGKKNFVEMKKFEIFLTKFK